MKVNIQIDRTKKERTRPPILLWMAAVAVVYALLLIFPGGPGKAESGAPSEAPQNLVLPPLNEHAVSIARGETLSDVLEPYGFSAADIHNLREDVKPVYDLARIKAGHELTLRTYEDGGMSSLQYDIDSEHYLLIVRDNGGFRGEIRGFPIETHTALIWGRIDNMLIAAMHQVGEKDQLAIELADLFAWDIDFYADMRPGDRFRVLVEKRFLENEFIGYGPILAAEFVNQGKTFQAYRYTYPDTGKWDYFTFQGQSLRKEFLKSPINGARITSRFSHNRLHPVRKVYRPHYGVDYGASVGTPVQSTADGTVTFLGRNGAAGRMVRIRHKNAYETMYLHLSRYGKGIRRGVKVTGGQVIGYVGASGEVSGPHLDYRIRYHGKYVNPLAHKFKPVAPLRKEFLADFQEDSLGYQIALDAPLWVFGIAPFPAGVEAGRNLGDGAGTSSHRP